VIQTDVTREIKLELVVWIFLMSRRMYGVHDCGGVDYGLRSGAKSTSDYFETASYLAIPSEGS
jgi:hypothetical protein